MYAIKIVIQAIIKMLVMWTSLALIALPLAKVGIDIAYEIWRHRNECTK